MMPNSSLPPLLAHTLARLSNERHPGADRFLAELEVMARVAEAFESGLPNSSILDDLKQVRSITTVGDLVCRCCGRPF